MQWSYKARELMRNECRTGKIWRNDTPLGGDIQNQEKENFTSLGKIYKITGETRRNRLLGKKRETLEKKDTDQNRDGEKSNIISHVNGRFLFPFQKSPINSFSRLFLNIFPRYTHFPLIRTLSLFPYESGLCFKNHSQKNRYAKDKKTRRDVC